MFETLTMDAALEVGFSQFTAILLLVFGLFLILAGIFTAYFGSGKSRTIGVVLLVVGVVVGIATALYYHNATGELSTLIEESLLVIVAAVIGALAAVAIFLVAIMKS
ncbi:MAG TPA: hypothetical protein VGV64_00120 [Thermoplasmata archaeon]|nr:hypothetical protein [Thermoplasmata archaeon]HEV2428241.1 hypothetical protein [Thermoplasmata archaeon]